jgi:RimJ/RimL family protein N-acetyltransferase
MGNTSIQTILGITLPDNITSINLLEKLGLKYEGLFLKDDEELLRYSISKPDKR